MIQNSGEGDGFEIAEGVMAGETVAGCGGAADAAEKSCESAFASQGGVAFVAEGLDGCDVLGCNFWNGGRRQGCGDLARACSAMTAGFLEFLTEVGE